MTDVVVRPGSKSWHKLFSRVLSSAGEILHPYDVAPDGQRFLLNVPDRPPSLFFLQGLDTMMGKN